MATNQSHPQQQPRKLSMRKSNGSIVDSSEDDSQFLEADKPGSVSSPASPLTSINRQTPKAYQFLQAAKYFFQVYSKSLDKTINIKIQKQDSDFGGKIQTLDYNTIKMSNMELILRRIQPYHCYAVTFHKRTQIDSDGNGEDNKNEEQKSWTKIVQIAPVESCGGDEEENPKTGEGLMSKISSFNVCGSEVLGEDFDIGAEIDISISCTDIKIAKEVKLSLINHADAVVLDPFDVKLLLKKFFSKNQLLYDGDVIELTSEDNESIFFEISFPNGSASNGQKTSFYVNQSTTVFQLPAKRRIFPRQKFEKNGIFVPENYRKIEKRMRSLLAQKMGSENFGGEKMFSDSLVMVLASTSSSDSNKIVQMLADNVGVDVVRVDCLDFWNIEGRSTEKLVDSVMEDAKNSSPALIIFENVVFLTENASNSLESGNKILENLCRKIIDSLSCQKLGIIFTCSKMDLPNLPKSVTNLIHFEFILPDLTSEDRTDFILFHQATRPRPRRGESSKIIEISTETFTNLTRGFLLAELEQLLSDADREAVFDGYAQITEQHIQKAIDKRNKSFSDAVGAPKIPTVKWDDVGGLEDVKKIISESLKMNLQPDKRKNKINLKRSGIVLYGPPGCGKTLMAKAVANEFNITFLSVKGPELLNQYVGQSEHNLRIIFEKARLASPSIIFFDEIDSLAPNRGAAGDSGGVMDRMVSQLLGELDTLHSKQNCNVFVMAATNRPDLLDPCLLTPGRFDKSVHVKAATDLNSKTRILAPLCKKIDLEEGLTPEEIAKMCPAVVSGADLSSVVQKSTMAALKKVILDIESRNLKGDAHSTAVDQAEVVVRKIHVEQALDEILSQKI